MYMPTAKESSNFNYRMVKKSFNVSSLFKKSLKTWLLDSKKDSKPMLSTFYPLS